MQMETGYVAFLWSLLIDGELFAMFDMSSCPHSVFPGRHVQPCSAQQEQRGGDHGGVSSACHQSLSGLAQTATQCLSRGCRGQEAVVSLTYGGF